MKKLRRRLLNPHWLPYTVATCSAVLLYVLLTHMSDVKQLLLQLYSYVSPVLCGIVLAYLLNPISSFFSERCLRKMRHRKLARILGVIITATMLLAILAFMAMSVFPHLVTSIELLVNNLDSYISDIQNKLNELAQKYEFLHISTSDMMGWTDFLKKAIEWLPENLPTILAASVRIGSGVFNTLIVFVIALYILVDKDRLLRGLKRISIIFIPCKTYTRILSFCRRCDHIIIRYVGSDLLDALIIGVANFLFLVIFGMPYTLLISVIAGVTNLIPTFGPIIGAVPAVLIIFLVDPWMAFWFIIWTMIIQTIDGYVIKPLLYGDTLGLPAVWVLVSIIVGGRILGILGVLLAIPFAAICSYLLDKIIQKKQLQRDAQAAAQASDAPPDAAGKEQSQDEQQFHE